MKALFCFLIPFYSLIGTHTIFAQPPKLIVPIGHSSWIESASFSVNGKYVLTASSDKTAKIWEVSTGKLLHDLTGHLEGLSEATFSSDGKYVVTGSYDNTAKIWDAVSGKLVHDLTGHTNWITSAEFSPDGKYIMSTSAQWDLSVIIWDVSTGKLLYDLNEDDELNRSAFKFSPDGKYVAGAFNTTMKIWETPTGKLLHNLTGHTDVVYSLTFSPDGKYLVTASNDKTAKIWEVATGKLLYDLNDDMKLNLSAFQFSPDGKYVAGAFNTTIKIWEMPTGKLLHNLTGHTDVVYSPTFSSDGKYLVTASNDKTAKIWEVAAGKVLHNLTGHTDVLSSAKFSSDGKYVITHSKDKTTKIWEISNGKLLHSLTGYTDHIIPSTSPDGKYVVTISDNTAKIWETSTGKLFHDLSGSSYSLYSAAFTPDGRYIITQPIGSKNNKIMDTSTGKVVYNLPEENHGPTDKRYTADTFDNTINIYETLGASPVATIYELEYTRYKEYFTKHINHLHSAEVSPDGKYVVVFYNCLSDDHAVIWDASASDVIEVLNSKSVVFSPDGKYVVATLDSSASVMGTPMFNVLHSLNGHTDVVKKATFSSDGKYVVTDSKDNTTKVWDTITGKLLSTFQGQMQDFNTDFTTLLTIQNSKLTLYSIRTGQEQLSWIAVDSTDWVVMHPSGLFDASPGAMEKLYFVQGLDVIEFNQLKKRYYEPGLWKKVMAGEELRKVVGFKSIDLPPDIEVSPVDKKGYLPVKLINRGGGIGQVNIFINGKEIIQDARDKKTDPNAQSVQLNIYIGNHKNLVKGSENFIGVKAWNADHWVVSRGKIINYYSKEAERYAPSIHILSCGVSDYTGTELDLKYAAKDAEDVSKALKLGAQQLFGIERSYVYTLTTNQAKELFPTKENIVKTLDKISKTAHPLDVFVMYLSGHGINYGGQDGDWYYLTQDAYTGNASAYNDPAIRKQTTFSSNELVELFKKVPALKQVLMIDACASGKVVENLMTQKDVSSSTLRALDRMRDRTGMHIITGCTADAVSYEASKYGQGVLTYSILEGLRGAALREEQYIDINKLFQYAQDRVPVLAQGIGGIQTPQTFSPQGSQSFDIGLLTESRKKEIPIAKIRPVYIRSNFQEDTELEDILGLDKIVDEALNEVSTKGSDAKLIFVDVKEYPDGCKLIGRYKKDNDKISLTLRKKCGDESSSYELKADNVEQLKQEILKIL